MIGRTISHYKILQTLGEGGMGAVYLAQDTKLGRHVAIKFPLDERQVDHHFRARFLREARAASALNHPNIATIYDYGETPEGQPFIVMEYVEGRGLDELIAGCALNVARTVEVIAAVASALSAAHTHGIIHRDIKPSNILINERGQIKVLDFGLAKQIKEVTPLSADLDAKTLPATLTQSNTFVGTPLYFSPEQASALPTDGRSDIFALGAVLYECLTGRPAFPGLSVLDIAAKILHVDPPPPSNLNPDVPRVLDDITLKALAKQPEARYQTADELHEELVALGRAVQDTVRGVRRSTLEQEHPHLSAAFTRTASLLTRPRLSPVAGIGVLLVIALAIWGIYAYRHRPYQPPADAAHWYDMGSDDLRDGTYYKAMLAFQHAVNIDPQFALAHARLAEAWMELDYPDRATEEVLQADNLAQERAPMSGVAALYLNAIRAVVGRDFTRAIGVYQKLTQQVTDEERAKALLDLGRAYEKNEDITHAIENYQAAIKLDASNAAAHLRLGILYGRKQDQQNAEASFAEAEKLYNYGSNFEGLTEVLYQRAALLNRLNQLVEARKQLLAALDKVRTLQTPKEQIQPQQIRIMLQLGIVERKADNTAQAEQYVKDAIALAQNNGIDNLATQGLIDLGNVYFQRGDFATAERYFNQALAIAQRNHGRYNEARALFSLGSMRIQSQDNPAAGLQLIQQALPFFQQGSYRKETALSLLLQGRAQSETGDYKAALATYQPLLDKAREVGDKQQQVLLLIGIGTVYARQERYPDALKFFAQAAEVSTASGARSDDSFNLLSRAEMLWRLGQAAEARTTLEQARVRAEQPPVNKSLAAQVHLLVAEIAASEQRYAEAIKESQTAMTLDDAPARHTALEAQAVLGLAQVMSGAKEAGLKACTDAADAVASASDPRLRAVVQLMCATAQLATGDNEAAATTALQANKMFTGAGQLDSAWRAWLVAGLAAERMGATDTAREHFMQARNCLQQLQAQWGADDFDSYRKRADMRLYLKQLDQALPAAS